MICSGRETATTFFGRISTSLMDLAKYLSLKIWNDIKEFKLYYNLLIFLWYDENQFNYFVYLKDTLMLSTDLWPSFPVFMARSILWGLYVFEMTSFTFSTMVLDRSFDIDIILEVCFASFRSKMDSLGKVFADNADTLWYINFGRFRGIWYLSVETSIVEAYDDFSLSSISRSWITRNAHNFYKKIKLL